MVDEDLTLDERKTRWKMMEKTRIERQKRKKSSSREQEDVDRGKVMAMNRGGRQMEEGRGEVRGKEEREKKRTEERKGKEIKGGRKKGNRQ